MYTSYMNHVTSSLARQNWAETVDRARRAPVTVTDHGRESVTIMDADLAKRALQALEDSEDAAAALEALAAIRAGEPTIALADVARELGVELG